MSTTTPPPDDSVPLEVGWQYWLAPNASSNNWVEIQELTNRHVRYTGVYPTIADQTVLRTQFDDLVRGYKITGYFLLTEDSDSLITEDGDFIFAEA